MIAEWVEDTSRVVEFHSTSHVWLPAISPTWSADKMYRFADDPERVSPPEPPKVLRQKALEVPRPVGERHKGNIVWVPRPDLRTLATQIMTCSGEGGDATRRGIAYATADAAIARARAWLETEEVEK